VPCSERRSRIYTVYPMGLAHEVLLGISTVCHLFIEINSNLSMVPRHDWAIEPEIVGGSKEAFGLHLAGPSDW
jgi:hypothetical protein